MIVSFGPNRSEPAYIGRVDDGWISVQVINGAGLWVGQSEGIKSDQGSQGIVVASGFFVTPADGIVNIPWTGDVYAYSFDQVSEVYGNIQIAGCDD